MGNAELRSAPLNPVCFFVLLFWGGGGEYKINYQVLS